MRNHNIIIERLRQYAAAKGVPEHPPDWWLGLAVQEGSVASGKRHLDTIYGEINVKEPPRFKKGDRVICIGFPAVTGLPPGAIGTVAEVAGFNGKSIYCDPSRRMVFVDWDNFRPQGVFKFELSRAP